MAGACCGRAAGAVPPGAGQGPRAGRTRLTRPLQKRFRNQNTEAGMRGYNTVPHGAERREDRAPPGSSRPRVEWMTTDARCPAWAFSSYDGISALLPSLYHPSGSSQCTSPSIQYRASNLDWQLVSYMVLYMFQCLLSCAISAYSAANQPLHSRVIIVC